MAEYREPLCLEWARESSEGGGIVPADGCGEHVTGLDSSSPLGGYALPGGGVAFTLRLPIPVDAEIMRARLVFTGGFVGTLEAIQGQNTWVLTGAAAGATLANGAPVFDETTGNTITVGGAAAAAVDLAATTVRVHAMWRRGPNLGVPPGGADWPQATSALVGSFSNDALDDNPLTGSLLGLFARTERQLNGQAGTTNIQRIGAPGGFIQLNQCTFAYADPWGRCVLTAADLGVQPGQVPVDRTTWNSQQFFNQPQVFVRLGGGRIRAVTSARRWFDRTAFGVVGPTTPITDPVLVAMNLFTVARAPTYSTWWVVIDGAAQEITFQHPPGSNYQRPADIWQNVIVPFMLAMSAGGGPGLTGVVQPNVWIPPGGNTQPGGVGTNTAVGPAVCWEVDPGQGAFPVAAPVFPAIVFRQKGQLPRRLSFLTYARMLHLWDPLWTYGNPILVPVQTTPSP
jgi:hypothetical protein